MLKKLRRTARKFAKYYKRKLTYFKKYERLSLKIRKTGWLGKKDRIKYKNVFEVCFLENIKNENKRDTLVEMYYDIEKKQKEVIEKYENAAKNRKSPLKPLKEHFFDSSVMDQKTGSQRPLLPMELEFANTYANALGFKKIIEERNIKGETKKIILTEWHAYRKALKEAGEKIEKEEHKDILEAAMYQSWKRDMAGQWLTLTPAYCYSGYQLLYALSRKHKKSRAGAMLHIPLINIVLMAVWSVALYVILSKLILKGVKYLVIGDKAKQKTDELKKAKQP